MVPDLAGEHGAAHSWAVHFRADVGGPGGHHRAQPFAQVDGLGHDRIQLGRAESPLDLGSVGGVDEAGPLQPAQVDRAAGEQLDRVPHRRCDAVQEVQGGMVTQTNRVHTRSLVTVKSYFDRLAETK